ncbi:MULTISPECIES: hypothetical protein [unclassified Bradyrhizobium]|uniref:hypothetical protein n=1 Tax=unclassified Bradyrhizobium TaxID=2631580 RepID=UPI001CD64EDA|nr:MULTISPECIES: hypothetical protein [unclassified Bradyrhizobium]MCA1372057.1 hypothetical protein [Bradyrhizobium sp. IC4060]MCA1487011.1 hypothetical protein [Bradyrhizobium sp. IC4061]MCA1540802.1 hypothetical protein [Bradyrhizobium sp. NBAIM32]
MESFIKIFQEISKGFMVIPFFRMLFYGIIFAIIMTFMIGWSIGVFTPIPTFPYLTNASHSPWIPVMFGSFSFLFAFAGYLSNLQLKEDILSPIRQKLVGIWEVRALTWKIDRTEIVQAEVVTHCTIGIEDVGRKLILHFEITNSDIFSDQSLDITNVMIAFVGEPKKLIYFQDHELTLREPIGTGPNQVTTARFPFLGVLNISTKNDEINEMSGLWYDIDNSVFNLARRIPDLRGMDDLMKELEKGSITFKGPLAFRRIDPPKR